MSRKRRAEEAEDERSITERMDDVHAQEVEQLVESLRERIDQATSAVCRIASTEASHKGDDTPFDAIHYPQTNQAVRRETERLVRDFTILTAHGTRRAWMRANHKSDTILRNLAEQTGVDLSALMASGERNLEGLSAFQERKTKGLGLSDHVWRVGSQYREQISLAVEVALSKGQSAQQLSREVRGLLNDPDRLFRRVRDKKGNLVPSRAMKAFHPPKGEYKSSYKNAMRLARTEINMAYRMADMQRWERMDFVLGFEVRRSDKERRQVKGKGGKVILMDCPLCDQLKGKYPKGFKFVGWHPQCLCYCVPILQSPEERSAERKARLISALKGEDSPKPEPSPHAITDTPEGFKEWVASRSAEQAEGKRLWSSPPYFVRDNFKDGDLSKGLNLSRDKAIRQTTPKPEPSALERSRLRHASRTPAQIADTQKRWDERAKQQTLLRAKARQEARTPEQKDDIQRRWDERKKKHALIRKTANNVLNVAKDYNEVDYSALQSAVDEGNINKMQALTREVAKVILEMKKQEQALSNLIPNIHEWHKQFTLDELKAVHSAVEKKLASWDGLTLQEKAKKLKFEAEEYFGTDKYGAQTKYKTWGVAQDAYKMHLDKVQYKIDKKTIEASVTHSFSFAQKTKSTKVKQLVSELQSLLENNATIAELQSKADALNSEVSKLEAAKLARDLKKLSKLGNGFSPDAYTQERKDKAVWDKGSGKIADKTLIDVAAKNWIASTEDEKDRIYEYTHHYCNVNEPLQGRKYLNHQTKADFEHRVNNITSYISKNILPEDMWFMRGDDGLGVIASRIRFAGGEMPNDLQDLVGMTMQEGGFMSTGSRKGKGFSNKSVIINVYAPKGTQAAYIEPISAFGDGAGRKWDGKQRFNTFSSEHETLFQRGTLMRITKVYQVGGKTFIDCEVIGQEVKPLSYVSDSNIGY